MQDHPSARGQDESSDDHRPVPSHDLKRRGSHERLHVLRYVEQIDSVDATVQRQRDHQGQQAFDAEDAEG